MARTVANGFCLPWLCALLLCLFGCDSPPRSLTMDELHAQAENRDLEIEAEAAALMDTAAKRLALKCEQGGRLASGAIPFDVLILSGGGEYGAFGAGFLSGWGRFNGEANLQRPVFDIVTGISTGALIAPYALLGRNQDYDQIERLYVNLKPSFIRISDLLFFLPSRPGFYDTSGLTEYIRCHVDQQLLTALIENCREHGLLLLGTTDLDLAQFHIWNIGREIENNATGNNEALLEDIMLASSAIPGVFPPILLQNRLHVDGGASEILFFANNPDSLLSMVKLARTKYDIGDAPVCIRIWIIVNGQMALKPEVIEMGWTSIVKRSIYAVLKSTTMSAIQRSDLVAQVVNQAEDGITCEFRYVAVPPEADIPESDSLFNLEITHLLIKLGQEMGERGDAWLTQPPTYWPTPPLD